MTGDEHQPFSFAERAREKERARLADRERLERGEISSAQLKRDVEAFAFPPSRVRIDFASGSPADASTRVPPEGRGSGRGREQASLATPGEVSSSFAVGDKPKLLLDVDGVLMPVRTPAMRAGRTPWFLTRPEFIPVRVGGLPGHVAPWVLSAAALLAECFDIIWATSWEDSANDQLRHLFGWSERPWLPILSGMRNRRTRLDVVREAVGEHMALVWCDDQGVTSAAREWAAQRAGTSLLIRPVSDRGLGPRHIARILAFGTSQSAR